MSSSNSEFLHLLRTTAFVLRRPIINRKTAAVVDEYSAGWSELQKHLEQAQTLNDWLRIPGVEDRPGFYNVKGDLSYQVFDSITFYRNVLVDALKSAFPNAKSITEYGCGVGRNLLHLKSIFPELELYGYELCQPGVDAGLAAASKFNLDVHYAQLDYVKDSSQKYVHPNTDVAYTMFSLEQLPDNCNVALKNILSRVRLGSIHIEPVPENYPYTFRGVLGRIDHWKVGYLRGFEKAVRLLKDIGVKVERLNTAHNPLMYPSVYILTKLD